MNNPKKIDLHLPSHWNLCTTEQLELIADVIREQVERQDRYHPFDMRNVKIAVFFALSGLEIVEAPDTRLDLSEQYYLCRMRDDKDSGTFPLYLWQINYWLSPKAKTDARKSAEYIAQGAGLLDWIDNENGAFLTRFPYPVIRRRRAWWRRKKEFRGPAPDLDGFSWAQYRFASDMMQTYTRLSNSLVKMQQRGTFTDEQMQRQMENVNAARMMFLATIFNGTTDYVDSNTGMVKHDFHYELNQWETNQSYFRDFPETAWQVILFWWTGVMHTLAHRYRHVFKVQPVKSQKPTTPLEIYTATTATMQKYAGLTEDQVNNQSYSLVLEHLERLTVENEEMEKIRKK